MTVVTFCVDRMLYAVYYYHSDNSDNIEITEVDDALADVVQFDIVYDPFRVPSLTIVDLSRLS